MPGRARTPPRVVRLMGRGIGSCLEGDMRRFGVAEVDCWRAVFMGVMRRRGIINAVLRWAIKGLVKCSIVGRGVGLRSIWGRWSMAGVKIWVDVSLTPRGIFKRVYDDDMWGL